MMLLSGNIDNDTVAAFVLKRNFDDVLISYTDPDVSKVKNETKLIYTAIFNFSDLKLSAAGEYTCTGIIDDAVNSSFIIQSNETADSGSIVIKSKRKSFSHFLFVSYLCLIFFPVPIPQVNMNITNITYTTGSELTLSCVFTLMNQNIDIDTEANVTWTNSTSVIMNNVFQVEEDNITYTSLLSFDEIKLSDASEYTCSGFIDKGENSFITHSDEVLSSGYISVISKLVIECMNTQYTLLVGWMIN